MTNLLRLLRDRLVRDSLYHRADYWDDRAQRNVGLARSVWPSNVYNQVWDGRQRRVLARAVGSFAGRRVLDLGCGTGRLTRTLADQGAEVVGVDISPDTVDAARAETTQPNASFAVGNVVSGLPATVGDFDDVLSVGCLVVACRDLDDLGRAFRNIATVLRPGGRLILLEPIHASRLLRRVVRATVDEWVSAATPAGMELAHMDYMGFVPVRLACANADLPRSLVHPLFALGERLLDVGPALAPLSDYKLVVLRRTA